ncbi:M1-specific T cell receptor beta chain-like [Misgurnus anguillicaudatus]|uniref:M1-specific T cell receptor beta chain-like n=1 Tax=Misgurnus anguillicaudatus TaxID=75329 RepID=UPI003CCF9E71
MYVELSRIHYTACCLDFSDGVLITQWPKFISDVPGSSVEMHCYQNDTNYDYKYWYRQKHGEWPVLIGSYIVNSATNEKDFESGFKVSGTEKKKWTLMIEVKKESNAVYLCAASLTSTHIVLQSTLFVSALPKDNVILNCSIAEGKSMASYTMLCRIWMNVEVKCSRRTQGTVDFGIWSKFVSAGICCDSGAGQAYFGNGTKLTVLESGKDVTEPEVKIIEPSKKQLCKKHVTLVCVAKKFYPDHVTIKWKIGNDDVIKGVATDPYATKDKKGMFDMSSRLKIKSNVYHNADKKFTCTVTFYNGTDYIDKSDTVNGIQGKGFNKENHMTEAATVKLAYGVFIAKSGLYGIFIFFFVRRQVSAGK